MASEHPIPVNIPSQWIWCQDQPTSPARRPSPWIELEANTAISVAVSHEALRKPNSKLCLPCLPQKCLFFCLVFLKNANADTSLAVCPIATFMCRLITHTHTTWEFIVYMFFFSEDDQDCWSCEPTPTHTNHFVFCIVWAKKKSSNGKKKPNVAIYLCGFTNAK